MFEPSATGPAGTVNSAWSCASFSTLVEMLPMASDSGPDSVKPEGTDVRTSAAEPLEATLSPDASPSVTPTVEPPAAPALTLTRTTTLNDALRARKGDDDG